MPVPKTPTDFVINAFIDKPANQCHEESLGSLLRQGAKQGFQPRVAAPSLQPKGTHSVSGSFVDEFKSNPVSSSFKLD